MNDIKALSERLGFLKISEEEASSEYKQIETKMLTAPVATNENVQAGMPKRMVADPGWFDRDQMKFKD